LGNHEAETTKRLPGKAENIEAVASGLLLVRGYRGRNFRKAI